MGCLNSRSCLLPQAIHCPCPRTQAQAKLSVPVCTVGSVRSGRTSRWEQAKRVVPLSTSDIGAHQIDKLLMRGSQRPHSGAPGVALLGDMLLPRAAAGASQPIWQPRVPCWSP